MNKRIIAIAIILFLAVLCQSNCYASLQYQEVYNSSRGSHKVVLVVNSAIYTSISSSLNQYIADLEAKNYCVKMTKFISGTPAELRNYLKLITGLEGAVFIGDLPVAWLKITRHYYDTGQSYTETFHSDCFYMDLDSQWQDSDADGMFETRVAGVGDLYLEIWMGRLTASLLDNPEMDQVGLIKNYFRKDHAYRTGDLPINRRALVFFTWGYHNETVAAAAHAKVKFIYPDLTIKWDTTPYSNITGTDAYKSSLQENYEWIQLDGHSTAYGHALYHEWVTGLDVRDIDPKTLFYALNACVVGDYTYPNYIGGHYVFAKTNGLGAFAATKSTGGLTTSILYDSLGRNSRLSLGQAYLLSINSQIARSLEAGGEEYSLQSNFDKTLLGDPTLTIDPPVFDKSVYTSPDSAKITIVDAARNTDNTVIETISFSAAVYRGSNVVDSESFQLQETAADSGVFTKTLPLVTTPISQSGDLIFQVANNDVLTVPDYYSTVSGSLLKAKVVCPLSIVSLSPNSGSFTSGTAYTFTTVCADNSGYANIKTVNLLINTDPTLSGGFSTHYHKDFNALHVFDNGIDVGSCFPGSSDVISSNRGQLYCSQTTVSGSGNNQTVNWRVSFKPTLSGTKNVYLSSTNKNGLSTGTVQMGTFTVKTIVPVSWRDMVGVSLTGTTLKKTTATGWGNSGAASQQSFAANGGVQFTVSETNTYRMVGLSYRNSDANFTTIDYGIYPSSDGYIRVYEKGVYKGKFSTYSTGNTLSVERVGTKVYYKKNGITFYTSATSSSGTMIVDAALYTNGATIVDAKIFY